jgi:protein involved in polysaccharide export with SLBB domain
MKSQLRPLTLRLSAFLLAGLPLASHAQDAGFQPAATPSRQAAPTAPVMNRTDEAKGAGLIDSMERLDATTTLIVTDKISFRIVEENAPPISLRVQDSGDIQAPHVGLVRAAGKTPKALAYEIKKGLEGSYFRVATVIIALDERQQVRGQGRNQDGTPMEVEFFTIFGQVIRQGKYELPFNEDVTVSQAVLRAGGFSQFAKATEVRVIRKTPQGNKAIKVNVDAIMTRGELERDIYIRNNDVIIVKESIAKF